MKILPKKPILFLKIFIKNLYYTTCLIIFSRIYTKKKLGSYGEFYFHSQFYFSNFNKWFQSDKNKGFSIFYENAKNKKCILDVGSHIGLTILPISSKNNFIHAFDISKTNCLILQKHLKINNKNNVKINNLCVSNKTTKIKYYDTLFSSPNNTVNSSTNNIFNSPIMIESIKLDDYVHINKLKPDVIKIDVEGYEYFVLEGAIKIINKYNPLIILSYHPNLLKKNGINNIKFMKLVNDLQLSIKRINGKIPSTLKSEDYILQKC